LRKEVLLDNFEIKNKDQKPMFHLNLEKKNEVDVVSIKNKGTHPSHPQVPKEFEGNFFWF
jgi:hypothetical protein